MSFLKTDGLYFEDEETDEDNVDSEEENEELEDYTPDEDEEDPEDEDEEDEEDEDLFRKLRDKLEKRILNRIKKRALTKGKKLSPVDHAIMQKLKKRHPKEVKEILRNIALKEGSKKAIKTGGKAIGGVGGFWILLIILIVLVITAIIVALFGASPEEPTNSEAGIKGEDFYGARIVYRDDVLAQNALIEQYVDVFESAVTSLQTTTFTESIGGTEYEVKVIVNLTLPTDDFNYENIDLADFATNYADLYNIVVDMAKLSYKVDNDIENDADIPTDLTDILNGVKYFGFNGKMIGSDIVDEDPNFDNNIIEIVYDTLKIGGSVTIQERLYGSNGEFKEATHVTIQNVDDNIRETIISSINVAENKVRIEKLFIKDAILEDSDSSVEGIDLKQYEAFIYLPKQSVEVNFLSYFVIIKDGLDINLKMVNNGEEIALTKGEAEYPYDDKSYAVYKFNSSENLNVTMSETDIIDVQNVNKFENATSLVKILADTEIDYNVYLEAITLDNGDTVLTYKKGSTYLLFEVDGVFKFTNEIG